MWPSLLSQSWVSRESEDWKAKDKWTTPWHDFSQCWAWGNAFSHLHIYHSKYKHRARSVLDQGTDCNNKAPSSVLTRTKRMSHIFSADFALSFVLATPPTKQSYLSLLPCPSPMSYSCQIPTWRSPKSLHKIICHVLLQANFLVCAVFIRTDYGPQVTFPLKHAAHTWRSQSGDLYHIVLLQQEGQGKRIPVCWNSKLSLAIEQLSRNAISRAGK